MTEQIAPPGMPRLINVATDTSRKPIDSAEALMAELERELVGAALYLAALRKNDSPAQFLEEQVAAGTTYVVRRYISRLPYCRWAQVWIAYETSTTSVVGTIHIATTTDATGVSFDVEVGQTSNTNTWSWINASIEIGAGDDTDLGVEEVIVTFDHTGASGTLDPKCIAVHPRGMNPLEITP